MDRACKKLIWLVLALVLVLQIPFSFAISTAEAATLSTARVSVHDPSVVTADNKYYIFGSHMANAVTSDLASWKTFTTNINTDYASIFSVNGAWAARGSSSYDIKGNLWAPSVIYNPSMKKWCMYMSINGSKYYSSIAMATANSITGPYTYAGTVVYSVFTNSTEAGKTDYGMVIGNNTVASRYLSKGAWNTSYGPNAIDPCVVFDKDGQLWMSYGSWFGGIFMLKLNNSTGLRDYSFTYPTTTNVSDQYLGIRLSGGYGCTGEGSYIVWDKDAGYYYMYLSYCGLDATDSFSGYHIRLFRSRNITGPYTDAAGNSAVCTSSSADQTTKGIKLMGNYYLTSLKGVSSSELSAKGYMSPGHNSAFIDDDGQRYLVYHTRFNTGNEYHQVRVHQQFLNADGWPVTAVYEYLGSKISPTGYPIRELVGTYNFINHGNSAKTAYTGMLPTHSVTLNSDGTISGDYKGTWTAVPGTYYCTMVIDGVTYNGVFFKQYDESSSHKVTMTFSLIGSNDQAIWGSQTSNQGGSAPSEGLYIKDLKINDSANSADWSIQSNLQAGDTVYGDREFKYSSIPETLKGSEWIKTACDSKTYSSDMASFTAKSDISVYVGLYSGMPTIPAWLKSWKKTGESINTDNSAVYDLYSKDFKAGEVVTLGNNGATAAYVNYTAIIKPYTAPTFMYGDVNGDNIINALDLAVMKSFILGKITEFPVESGLKAADVNGDTKIDALDFAVLKQYLLGKINDFPVKK